MVSNFSWHTEAPCFTYWFCYDSQRRYIDVELYENTFVVEILNYLKSLSRCTVSKRLPIHALYNIH